MSLQDELLNDESIIFDPINGLAKPMRLKTLKGFSVDNSFAIFDENNTNMVMNEGLETNNSSALIQIPRSVFNIASKNESIVRGWIITNVDEKKDWEVQAITEKDEISVSLICQRTIFSKAKG